MNGKLALAPRLARRQELLLGLDEDIAFLSEKTKPVIKSTQRSLRTFLARYGVLDSVSGYAEKKAFFEGRRFSLSLSMKDPMSKKRYERFMADSSRLAELGIGITYSPDGNVEVRNLNYAPAIDKGRRNLLKSFLERAKAIAKAAKTQKDLEPAYSIHLAFLSIMDNHRAMADYKAAAQTAARYRIRATPAELRYAGFVDRNKKFDQKRFERTIGISYARFKEGGFGAIAGRRLNAAVMNAELANTFYIDVMRDAALGKKKTDYEAVYAHAAKESAKANQAYTTASTILFYCRTIASVRQNQQGLAPFIYGSGIESEFPYIKARDATDRMIKKGLLKIGTQVVRSRSELRIPTQTGRLTAAKSFRPLVQQLNSLESYQKNLVFQMLAGNTGKTKDTVKRIHALEEAFTADLEKAVKAFSTIHSNARMSDGYHSTLKSASEEAVARGELSKRARDLLAKEIDKVKAAFDSGELTMEKAVQGYQKVGQALSGAIAFERLIKAAKSRLKAVEADLKVKRMIEEEKAPTYITRRGEKWQMTTYKPPKYEPVISKDEIEFIKALMGAAEKETTAALNTTRLSAALDHLQKNYDPMRVVKEIVTPKKGRPRVRFDDQYRYAKYMKKINNFSNALYMLTWRARLFGAKDAKQRKKALADGRTALGTIFPNLIGLGMLDYVKDSEKVGLQEYITSKNLVKKGKLDKLKGKRLEDFYTDFVKRSMKVARNKSFQARMAKLPWYKTIIPYTIKFLDEYGEPIFWGLTAVGAVASILSAEPLPSIGAAAARTGVKELAKRFGKRLIFGAMRGLEYASIPFVLGGAVTVSDGLVKYISGQEAAIDQIRKGTIWLTFGLGASTLRTPGISRLPGLIMKARKAYSFTTHSLLFTGVGLSMMDRLKSKDVNWVGLAGDVAYLTVGSVSAFRTIKGFRAVQPKPIPAAGPKMRLNLAKGLPKPVPEVTLGRKILVGAGTVGEIGLFVGGTFVYLADYLPKEMAEKERGLVGRKAKRKLVALGKAVGRTEKERYIAEMKEKARIAAVMAAKITKPEEIKAAEALRKKGYERGVTLILFPNLYSRYLDPRYKSLPDNKIRQGIITEINKRLRRTKADVFNYLKDAIGIYFAYPDRLKKSDPGLYDLIHRLPEKKKDILARQV